MGLCRRVAVAMFLVLLSARYVHGQVQGQPSCNGALVAIRISDLKPGATMDQFMSAIDAQKAWYVSHGFKDEKIFVSQILVRTLDTNNFSFNGKQVMTYHYYSPASAKGPAHDAAWDAFVKKFSDISVIKESILNCMPKEMAPSGGR